MLNMKMKADRIPKSQVGGDPSQDLSEGMGPLCLMALRSDVEEKSIAIGGRRKTRQPSRAK